MFSNCKRIKLEINNNSKIWKCTNMWKLNNTYLNDQWVKEITKDIKNILRWIQTKIEYAKTCRIQLNQSLEIYS